ncbi:hypothetical protein HMPREF9503_02750 [Enterococcus faecalis TX0043]|nr:hypothetical protein HMPREF9503_02750 [Enterococcus faecalis TX0043]EPH68230.1 hypothetical protein D929_02880 [Enterococcus faecalis 02-MB-P-10]
MREVFSRPLHFSEKRLFIFFGLFLKNFFFVEKKRNCICPLFPL